MLHAIRSETEPYAAGYGTSARAGRYPVCGGHRGAYTAGWVIEGTGRLAVATSAGPLLRITSYDADTGTLYLEADADDTGAEADLTDDEMIVVRNAAGQVVSVTVPFIDTYWSRHWIALTEALSRIGRFDRAGLARAIGRPDVTTRHISAYRAARTASAGPYRAGAGLDR